MQAQQDGLFQLLLFYKTICAVTGKRPCVFVPSSKLSSFHLACWTQRPSRLEATKKVKKKRQKQDFP